MSENNTEYSGDTPTARQKVIGSTINSSYYFLLDQVSALNVWNKIVNTPSPKYAGYYEQTGTLSAFSSHHNPVYRYMEDCIKGDIPTLDAKPGYPELFTYTRAGYWALERRVIRSVFSPDVADPGQTHPDAPISIQEVKNWMINHSKLPDGLIAGIKDPDSILFPADIPEITRGTDLARLFMLSLIDGGNIDDRNGRWVDEVGNSMFSGFSDQTKRLALCKLACGMAVVDLAAAESAKLELPLSPDFKPELNDPEDETVLEPFRVLWEQSVLLIRSNPSHPLYEDILPDAFPETSS